MGKPRQLKLLGDQLVAVDENQTARVSATAHLRAGPTIWFSPISTACPARSPKSSTTAPPTSPSVPGYTRTRAFTATRPSPVSPAVPLAPSSVFHPSSPYLIVRLLQDRPAHRHFHAISPDLRANQQVDGWGGFAAERRCSGFASPLPQAVSTSGGAGTIGPLLPDPKLDGEWAGRRHPAEPGHVVLVRVWRLGRVVGDDRFAAADEDLLTRDRLQLGSQVAGAALGVDPRFEVTWPEIAEHRVGVGSNARRRSARCCRRPRALSACRAAAPAADSGHRGRCRCARARTRSGPGCRRSTGCLSRGCCCGVCRPAARAAKEQGVPISTRHPPTVTWRCRASACRCQSMTRR